MKKIALPCFLWLMTVSANATDAVVIVLEAPLLKQPSMKAKVMQTIRKGERVYVPSSLLNNAADLPEFIPTFDRVGNQVYVPSRFIKVITNNNDEYKYPVTLAEKDPTDYRLEEPIPETYPFSNDEYVRASLSLYIGNNSQAAYSSSSTLAEQDLKNEVGGRVVVTRKIVSDGFDRIYFGFIGSISNTTNEAVMNNQSQISDSRALYRGGPFLTYDTYKTQNVRLSFGGGFTYNYHKSLMSAQGNDISEDRIFSGFSLSPLINTTLQIQSMVPYTDFIAGADVNLFLPYSLKAEGNAEIPALWSEENTIKSDPTLQASLFFGIQVRY